MREGWSVLTMPEAQQTPGKPPQAPSGPDQADIAAILGGEKDAFERIVRRYERPVAVQMRRFAHDWDALEDLVQEVFVETYLSLPRYGGHGPFLHWLRSIATRVGYRYWREQTQLRWVKKAFWERYCDTAVSPTAAAWSEAAERLPALMARLDPRDRAILTLRYGEGRSSQEIAERLGGNATLVRVRAHRARQRLKRLLVEEEAAARHPGPPQAGAP